MFYYFTLELEQPIYIDVFFVFGQIYTYSWASIHNSSHCLSHVANQLIISEEVGIQVTEIGF